MAFASIGYWGCSDMNSLHDEYLQRGVTIYTGQPDSVEIFSGKNRVKITCRNYDPKAAKLTVYWDFRQGSRSFDVPTGKLGEVVEMIIPDLEEKNYTFELVATNPVGEYPSIPLYISGDVYGSRYAASLTNRKIVGDATFAPWNNRINIAWAKTVENIVGVELKYINSSNVETVLKVLNDEMQTTFDDSNDDQVEYRTLHLPEINCIDTFYTDYTPINLVFLSEEEKLLDKALFVRWNPAEIPYDGLGGWEIENLWNGTVDGNGFSSSSTSPPLPYSFTFDMGQTARLNRILIFPRIPEAYGPNHPRRMEIYGSATPDVTADVATWLYLGEFVSLKPSGSSVREDPVDIAYLQGGEVFQPSNTDVPVRYLRFIVTQQWSGYGVGARTTVVQLMELDVYGYFDE